jgi:2,5-furandicarboxylate decarboxylase 1
MAATPTPAARRQQSMPEFVAAMEKAGLLVRIPEEKRVDELPMLMEQHYDKAIFVERVQGSEFSFLANAYSNHQQYAWALGCTRSEIGGKTAELAKGRIKPKIVAGAPCKEVILKDADVDISRGVEGPRHRRHGLGHLPVDVPHHQ